MSAEHYLWRLVLGAAWLPWVSPWGRGQLNFKGHTPGGPVGNEKMG